MLNNISKKIKQFKKIDAHSHIGYFGGWSDVGITAEQLIDQMNEYNIVKTVISTFPMDESIKATDKYPERLVGTAWVNPYDGKKTLAQLKNSLENHQFKAIKLHPLFHSFIANDPIVFPIMEFAGNHDIPVMIHTGHPPFSLPWSVAQLAETYPEIKIVMIHMGHGNGMYIQAAIDMAKKYPNIFLENSGMPMHTKIKEAYEVVGEDRLMFGIDSPFHHPVVEISRVLVSGLNDESLKHVFYNNAAKLLKI